LIFCPAFRSSSVRRFSSKSPNRQTEAPLPLDAVVMALSPRVERKALLQARSTPPRRARAAHCSSGRARQGDLKRIMDQVVDDRVVAVSSATRARRGQIERGGSDEPRKGWLLRPDQRLGSLSPPSPRAAALCGAEEAGRRPRVRRTVGHAPSCTPRAGHRPPGSPATAARHRPHGRLYGSVEPVVETRELRLGHAGPAGDIAPRLGDIEFHEAAGVEIERHRRSSSTAADTVWPLAVATGGRQPRGLPPPHWACPAATSARAHST